MRANTGIELAGTPTASAMLDDPSQEPRLSAALLIHEAFHVFQAKRHPGWGANEADLFVYPVEIPPALALRRLESEGLRRWVLPRLAGYASLFEAAREQGISPRW